MANNSFMQRTTNRNQRKRLPTLDDLDIANITFGVKSSYKSTPGNFVPISYNNKPLSFQLRGLLVTFMGTSQKRENLDKYKLLERRYCCLVDAYNSTCEYMPNGQGDGKKLYEFQKKLESLIDQNVQNLETAKKWGCYSERKSKKTGKNKPVIHDFLSAICEPTPKKDENGQDTKELWNPSIKFPLRIAVDKKRNPIDAFTTVFEDEYGNKLDIKPSNVNSMVPYGTYAILSVSYGRMWIGKTEFKITVYVNKATLLFPKQISYETDSFITNNPSDNNDNDGDDGNDDNLLSDTSFSQANNNSPLNNHNTQTNDDINKELDLLVNDDDIPDHFL